MLFREGVRGFYLFSTFFPKSESERELFKAKWFFLQHQCLESKQISLEEIRYIFFSFLFFISFCSISSIWCPLLLVSPSNMWKMYSTMQSRWLDHHLLSHRSVLCIPADAFQNQKTILLGASEKGNENVKEKGGTCSHSHTHTLWCALHWYPAWCGVFPRTLGWGLNPAENLGERGSPRDFGRLGWPFVFLQNGHLEGRSVAERKGARCWQRCGWVLWGDLSCHHLSCAGNVSQSEEVRAKLWGTDKPDF